jgi:NtrC-family two-component system sensor histidine kinase KinB
MLKAGAMPAPLRRSVLIYAAAAALLGLLTWVDAVASAELSFTVFYFVPISLAAWAGSRRGGVILALASTACWWIADRFTPEPRSSAFPLYWEAITRLAAYVTMALGVSRLRAAVRHQRDLLRVVSHDLRSPLTALVGHAQLLARQAEPGSWVADRAAAMLRAGQRMNGMIEDLVDAARGRGRRLRVELQPVELGPFLRELLERMSASLPCDRVELALGPTPLAVTADPARLERIVVNLVSNALKYSPEEERVVIRAAPAGRLVVLSVEDRGPGIAPEDRAHLFERYYRGRASAGTEGVGLGLHGTRILVRALHGRIRVGEAAGGGAVFRVELPRAARPRPAAAAPPPGEGRESPSR